MTSPGPDPRREPIGRRLADLRERLLPIPDGHGAAITSSVVANAIIDLAT